MKLLGWALAMQGRHAEGLAHLREGLGAYRGTGALVGVPYDLALLAEVCGQARAIVDRPGERTHEAELHRLEGELRLSHEEPREEAEACFRQALDIARRLGATVARTASGIDQHEQHEHLTSATAMYREMDMRFWLKQAEADRDT